MPDNLRQSRLLADLPFDVLLKIFSECNVDDILNFSVTCKRLNEASGEHQTWLNQVTRLGIPIPTCFAPSTAELKDWAISWLRSDEPWVKPQDDDDRSLNLHFFKMQRGDGGNNPARFVMANLIPGGRFVVVLYTDGQIDLKEIETKSDGEWELWDVTRYTQDDPERFRLSYWSQLLTETNLGRPLVAYVDREEENLLVFVVDHIAGTIEPKQMVQLHGVYFYGVYSIHAIGNIIVCFYEHSDGWGITVSELGPNPALKHFTLNTTQIPQLESMQFSMVSENAVVICDAEGIRLYHIPELNSGENFSTLDPVWEWLGESWWSCGSVSMTTSQHPTLYLQEISAVHTIIFRMDASGRDPLVAEHRISGLPACLASLEEGDDRRFVMKGRKGVCYDAHVTSSEFDTFLLGIEGLAGGFGVELELPGDGNWNEHEVRLVDFDERTGRILIGTNRYGEYNEREAIRVYLADLPP